MTSPANVFNLSNSNLHITYATGELGSKAGLTYQDAHQTLQFNAQQIRKVSTDLGDEVSVTIRLTVDSGSTSFTLFIPRVALSVNQHLPIHTIGVTAIHRTLFVPIIHGQLDSYQVENLHGTASPQPF